MKKKFKNVDGFNLEFFFESLSHFVPNAMDLNYSVSYLVEYLIYNIFSLVKFSCKISHK